MNEKELYMDADWTPAELETKAFENPNKISDPVEYHEAYRELRNWSRKVDAFVQRCLVVSIGLFLWACALALLVGAVYG